ncbi:MAG: YitT family protein [Lachnospiraceae bacterium]|nr:YitT family protein [Lachnospiraceae bacterium]
MNKKQTAIVREFLYLTAAEGIIAAAVFFFLIPSQAAVSSIAGLAMVLSNIAPFPISFITLILNVILLIIGFFACGKEFGGKTVYTSLVLSCYLALFEHLFPNFTSVTESAELDVLCYILIVSFGSAILFNRNASSGGLDIVAKIMHQYLHMELGRAMVIAGICIAMTTIFFYDKKIVVLSLLGTYFNGMILDHFIFGQNLKRRVCIISENQEMIRRFLIEEIHSGATMYEAIGAYKMETHKELITIVDKNEYQKLMSFIRKNDPKAFVTVYTVSDIHYVVKS